MTESQLQDTKEDDYNPFTDEIREKVLHEEQTTSVEEGWTFIKKNDLCEVWRKQDPTQPIHIIKGFLNFKGIPPHSVVDIIHDAESRSKWDKLFTVIDVLETHKHYRIIYWLTKLPPGVSDRDLVQRVSCNHEEDTNTTFFIYEKATHPDRPERSGIVRAETIFSCVIIRPHPDDPDSTRMSLMMQVNMKGWIPHFIVNSFAARAPGSWQANLSDYYWNVYSKEKNAKDDNEATPQVAQENT